MQAKYHHTTNIVDIHSYILLFFKYCIDVSALNEIMRHLFVLACLHYIHVINICLLSNLKGLQLNGFSIGNVWKNLQVL